MGKWGRGANLLGTPEASECRKQQHTLPAQGGTGARRNAQSHRSFRCAALHRRRQQARGGGKRLKGRGTAGKSPQAHTVPSRAAAGSGSCSINRSTTGWESRGPYFAAARGGEFWKIARRALAGHNHWPGAISFRRIKARAWVVDTLEWKKGNQIPGESPWSGQIPIAAQAGGWTFTSIKTQPTPQSLSASVRHSLKKHERAFRHTQCTRTRGGDNGGEERGGVGAVAVLAAGGAPKKPQPPPYHWRALCMYVTWAGWVELS